MFQLVGYEIKEAVYAGQKSLVYRGLRLRDKKPIILKVPNLDSPEREELARFRQEYEIGKHLTGPGINVYLGLEFHGNIPAVVSEDFEAISLKKFIEAGPIDLVQFLKIAIKLSTALAGIHKHRIIHKDIKPTNMLYNPRTGEIRISDFSVASRLLRMEGEPVLPEQLEGSLHYMSPEQTGHTHTLIDYRTDFYAFGMSLYELLTGALPFQSRESHDLIQKHISGRPEPPHKINPGIPEALSQIILKLISKSPDDRYQSAYGIKRDLEECLLKWESAGWIDDFTAGQHDLADHFRIPQKLYGRQPVQDRVLESFEQIRFGRSEMILITAPPGMGKSALAQELQKPIVSRQGYFITGRFEQFQHSMPYSALVWAFRGLIRQLLSGESQSNIDLLKEKLLDALGNNAKIICDVIPELALVIGPQPHVHPLGLQETRNRFNYLFQSFVSVFTTAEHPLVLLLDDLHLADATSIKLLENLVADPERGHLLLIGTLREITNDQPLAKTLTVIRKAKVKVHELTLEPLTQEHLMQLITDALHLRQNKASDDETLRLQKLADLVLEKTGGVPFFVAEFLEHIAQEELIYFNSNSGNWTWSLQKIQQADMTDNVLELIAQKLQKLPAETLRLLMEAACIGNNFDLAVLSKIHAKDPERTLTDLEPALMEELILPLDHLHKLATPSRDNEHTSERYRFLHDRVQQVAYKLIPPDKLSQAHARIGHHLLESCNETELEKELVHIVNHLNIGAIEEPAERRMLADLNLRAGKKAKAASAYQQSLSYLNTGIELLAAEDWGSEYTLILNLHLEAVESALFCADFEHMKYLSDRVLNHAKTLLDKIPVYEIRIQYLHSQGKLQEALELAREVLAKFDIKLPAQPDKRHFFFWLIQIKWKLRGKRLQKTADLPEMQDAEQLAVMSILMNAVPSAYFGFPEMLPIIVFHMVDLTLKHGLSSVSAYGFAMLGMILCGFTDNINAGHETGKLALLLLEKTRSDKIKAKVAFIYHSMTEHWKEPLRKVPGALLETYHFGLESGDTEYAVYSLIHSYSNAILSGERIEIIEERFAKYLAGVSKLKQEQVMPAFRIYRQLATNLQGKGVNPRLLNGEYFNEKEAKTLHAEKNNSMLFVFYLARSYLLLLFRDYPNALIATETARQYEESIIGTTGIPMINFLNSLALLALCPEVSQKEQKNYLNQVTANQRQMRKWVRHCAVNYQHKYLLVEAELARFRGYTSWALEVYDQAIGTARKNLFYNDEALGYELAAKAHKSRGNLELTTFYITRASQCYRRWGALAKVQDLEFRYNQIVSKQPGAAAPVQIEGTFSENTDGNVEIKNVIRISQMLFSETSLKKLLTTLMDVIVEYTEAHKIFLVLSKDDRLLIDAEHDNNLTTVLHGAPLEKNESLPVSLLKYVSRNKKTVILSEPDHIKEFINDAYIRKNEPAALYCGPVLLHEKLFGILYVENRSLDDEKIKILDFLTSQIAIAVNKMQNYENISELKSFYERFVPGDFLGYLKKSNSANIQPGDYMQQEMTVLFANIHHFAKLSENMNPEENFYFLNGHLRRITPIIRDHHGFIQRQFGDTTMALFPRATRDALNAAIDIQRLLAEHNLLRVERGDPPIRLGTGLHRGRLLLGTTGDRRHISDIVISDAVETAAQVERLTKLLRAPTVVSHIALFRRNDSTQFHYRFIGMLQLKGKKETLQVYEVFNSDTLENQEKKISTRNNFEAGALLFYNCDFERAATHFEEVLTFHPEDLSARMYLDRCSFFQKYEIPPLWNSLSDLTAVEIASR